MKRPVLSPVLSHVLLLGLVGGVLIAVLRWSEYQFLVLSHSLEIYGALVAVLFAAFGIWLGIKLTKPRETIILREVPVPTAAPAEPFTLNQPQLDALGITPRELEILALIAQGLSNREIAGRLFVSENTVKTHCSRAFDKLGARRRTQAVQLGKQLGLLPIFILAFCIALSGCTENRHRVILYDQEYSSNAGVKNLWCSSSTRDACAQEARDAEMFFARQLKREFHENPECATVQFKVLSAGEQGPSGSEFWRLQVDFHTKFPRQSYRLARNGKPAHFEGDDADNVRIICQVAKQNGVMDVW